MYGCTQAAGKGLEHALDEVVIILATRTDVEVATQGRTQGVEEVAEPLGGGVAHILASEVHIPSKIDATTQVEQNQSITLLTVVTGAKPSIIPKIV